jgi:zinc D-Ala-D-Ala carboxypeptidase
MTLQETKFIKLSEHFTLYELVRSDTAEHHKLDNLPNEKQQQNLTSLVSRILEPARVTLGLPIAVSSGFRCAELNYLVHGSKRSQHLSGSAADLHLLDEAYGHRLFDILKANTNVDQLLMEHNSEGVCWIHVSYSKRPRHLINDNYIQK